MRSMLRRAFLLPMALAACTVRTGISPPAADAGPAAVEEVQSPAKPDLGGRWTVTEINGRPESGLWLELGGEGLATITTSGSATYVGSPQPPTRAYLGCNWWYPTGWTRERDELILGREMSRRTERGCDTAREALDDEAYAILTRPMAFEITPPDHLRLANESGTLELVRKDGEAE